MGVIVDATTARHEAERLTEIENREDGKQIKGDFEGSVTGTWKELGDNGAAIVEYKGKEYIARPIGFTALTKGAPVQLSHADGVYYAAW
jgi:hypothetical protein